MKLNGGVLNDWILMGFGFVLGVICFICIKFIFLSDANFLGADKRIQWETLLTGFLAVAAAIATVCVTRQMIRQTADLENERRSRRARAANAMLPMVLSELYGYSMKCMRVLKDIRGFTTEEGYLDRLIGEDFISRCGVPVIPENSMEVLKECIEFSDDKLAAALIDLIKNLQIQHSRMLGAMDIFRVPSSIPNITSREIDRYLVDAAAVSARCEALFPFARGCEGVDLIPSADKVCKALRIAFVDQDACRYAYELAGSWTPTFPSSPSGST